jgi:prepilin peptidase CpaA
MPIQLVTLSVAVFVVAVAVIDTRTHKIPNALTVSAALVALLIQGFTGGPAGALAAVSGLVVGLGLFLPAYLMRGIGAGDVKAMAAIGAFLGPKGVLLAAALTLIAGAVAGFAWLLALGGYPALRALARRWAMRVFLLYAANVNTGQSPPPDDPASRRFPYGIAIASGTLLSLAWS